MTEASQKLKDLVEEFCAGDAEACYKIVEAFNRLVISIAVKQNIPDEELENIAQEAWIRFFGSVCRKSLNVKSFLAYLYRIVINLCHDYHNQKQIVVVSLDEETFQRENEVLGQNFVVALKAQEVIEEIKRLPERERQAVFLKDKEGFTHKEIGQIMGETLGNVKTLIHRGRAKIRKVFNQQKT